MFSVDIWIAIICCLVLYKIISFFFANDDAFDVETSDSNAIFTVASRLEKLYGGKAYIGLRIPDADTDSRENIDIVLVSKGEVVVVAIKNLAGFVTVNSDGSWDCMNERKLKEEHHEDPILVLSERLEPYRNLVTTVASTLSDSQLQRPSNNDTIKIPSGEVKLAIFKNKPSRRLLGFCYPGVMKGFDCSCHINTEYNMASVVAKAKRQALVLEAYLERRGVVPPEGYLIYKVIAPNPKFRCLNLEQLPTEVITHDQWLQMKAESRNMLTGWIKGAFKGGKKEVQESVEHQLNVVLKTAPMWDRLELRGSKHLLGEFLEFKGKNEDTQALGCIKRSKVGQLTIQKTSMLGFAPRRLEVLYTERDYRTGGASASASDEWKEVNVRSSTEVVFQVQDSKKPHKFKLSSVSSMILSA